MSDDLKPCPFCTDGKSVSTYFDHEQGDKWGYAACDACGSRGPEVRTNYDRADDAPWRAEAIAAWNTRTPDTSIEALTEQLEAARADAKEAEAYAEGLEKEIELNEQEACMLEDDFIKAEKEIDDIKAKLAKAVEAAVDAGASLAAAISLLERGGRKAAPSNKMFDQMLVDYRNSLERTRALLAEIEGEKE